MTKARKASASSAVQITASAGEIPLSKAQKRFNSLIKKLDKQKKCLVEWRESAQAAHEHCARVLNPLIDEYRALELQRLRILDEAYANPAFKKGERTKLSYLICELALPLLAEGDGDEEIKALYNCHSDQDFDTMQRESDAEAGEVMKLMMGEVFGRDIGDADLSSPDKVHAFVEAQLLAEEAEREAQRASRKQSKRQIALEAQKEAEKARIQQSMQEIYRKLVTRLHPDREMDPVERERKTELMQQVNQAYEKKDLLKLLELQLQAEQIDQGHLGQIAEERLNAYNQLLKEQSDELQREIEDVEVGLRMQLNIAYYEALTPKSLMTRLNRDIRELRYQILSLQSGLRDFGDIADLKAWLKSYRIPKSPPRPPMDFFY
jgi:hypothetical protein